MMIRRSTPKKELGKVDNFIEPLHRYIFRSIWAHSRSKLARVLRSTWCAEVLVIALLGPAAAAQTAAGTDPVARVSTAPVQEQILRATTTGFGQVQAQPAKVISIAAPEAATIAHVFVRPGQIVKQRSALVELSAAPSTEEAFRKAQTAVDFARTKLTRMQYLWKRGATTKDLLDQAEIAYRNAQASLNALNRIGAQQNSQTVSAPISGTVTAVSVAEGDRVPQNAKILTMAPTNALAVLLGVEPEDVHKVETGMPVTLTPAFDGGAKYSGKVSAINQVIDPQTRLVDVMVDIDGSDGSPPLIGNEMRGVIELRQERLLTVQRTALLYDRVGAYVFVVRDGRARRVTVVPGLDGQGVIGVKGALKAGDVVVIQGNYELQDGMKVEQVLHAVP